MVKNNHNQNAGFTLFEVIMVIFLFSLISVIGTSLFFSIMKTTSKAEAEKEVKQNGDYAMSVMQTMIRNAKQVTPCETGASSLTIVNQKGSTNTIECFYEDGVAKISLDSGTLSNALTGSNVTVGTPGGTSCTGSSGSTLVFNCQDTSPQTVDIAFTLTKSGIGTKVEEQASVFFQTSVTLRNY